MGTTNERINLAKEDSLGTMNALFHRIKEVEEGMKNDTFRDKIHACKCSYHTMYSKKINIFSQTEQVCNE